VNKKKIRLISIIVAAALAVGVGGLVYAVQPPPHTDNGGHKLIGVGEMGYENFSFGGDGSITGPTLVYHYQGEIRGWDTQFIITNPNCAEDDYIDIEWVALIAGEDTDPGCWNADYDAEEVIFEGTCDDWSFEYGIDVPCELSGHEVWQVSIAELLYEIEDNSYPTDDPMYDEDLYYFIAGMDLNKYTLEVVWTGVNYGGWWGFRDWQGGRPLIGWQKEKCRCMMYGNMSYPGDVQIPVEFPGLAISEAPMEVFPGCNDFTEPNHILED
jgi:hypothetical protein